MFLDHEKVLKCLESSQDIFNTMKDSTEDDNAPIIHMTSSGCNSKGTAKDLFWVQT